MLIIAYNFLRHILDLEARWWSSWCAMQ